MRSNPLTKTLAGGLILGFVVVAAGTALAQDVSQAATANTTLYGDWLKPAEVQQRGETVQVTPGQTSADPFTVLSSDSLWQDKSGTIYTRSLADTLSLSCASSTTTMDDDAEQYSRDEKVGLEFKPATGFIFRSDLHDSSNDIFMPTGTTTSGAAFSAEGTLPNSSTLTFGLNSDRTTGDVPAGLETQTNAYDAQFKQPIGSLPLSAVLKGHYEGTSEGNAAPTSLPSLEQSLQWKPLVDTTVQVGLRQQQYQEYPGVDHELNEALFADWSQKVIDNVSWHSYAEVLNSKGLLDQAPASPIASGAYGTPQATPPGSNASLTSSLPISIDQQTLTFSTGPSFQVQKDISASLEYSDRWDKNPAAGSTGQEQRVSVSVKGTF